MQEVLYRQSLDLAAFAELEREPGRYLIEAWLKRPDSDKRIPAPPTSPAVLLVSYTLLASEVPPKSAWMLQVQGVGDDGKPRALDIHLLMPPPPGDNMVSARGPGGPPSPGALYRGVFWLDLAGPLKSRLLRPGDQLTLRYGTAATALSLPAAPR